MTTHARPLQLGPFTHSGPRFIALAFAVVAANALIVGVYPRFASGAPPEWPVIFDLLVFLPLLYLALEWRRGWSAVVGALALAGLGSVAGSLILPAESKQAWRVIEDIRLAVITVVLAIQIGWIGSLLLRVVRASRSENLEVVLHRSISERFGDGFMAGLFRFESRLWLYGLLRQPVRQAFPGRRHFHVGRQGMNASNQAAFLVLIGAEIPVAHLLIHLFDPVVALVVSALSLYGFLFMLAEYRATLHRPISVTADGLQVRYGVVSDFLIAWSAIADIQPSRGNVQRARGRLRLQGMGETNVVIELVPGTRLRGLVGDRLVEQVYLGVDEPSALIDEIRARRNQG